MAQRYVVFPYAGLAVIAAKSPLPSGIVLGTPITEPPGTLNRRAAYVHNFPPAIDNVVLSVQNVSILAALPADWVFYPDVVGSLLNG